MKTTRTLISGALLAASLACAGTAAAVPIEGVTFTNPSTPAYAGPVTVGYFFSVDSTIQVTDLGAFDLGGDGFLNSHDVGIFDANTTQLLASATVTSADPLTDGFRYASIAPLTLDNSTFYMIGAADYNGTGEDNFVLSASVTAAPDITFDGSALSQTHSGLNIGYLTFGQTIGSFGANFQYMLPGTDGGSGSDGGGGNGGGGPTAGVPEPGTLALLSAGLLGFGGLKRRRSLGRRD